MRPDFDDRPTDRPLRSAPVETVSRFEAAELTGRSLVESRREPRCSVLCIYLSLSLSTKPSLLLFSRAYPSLLLSATPLRLDDHEGHGEFHDRDDCTAGGDP